MPEHNQSRRKFFGQMASLSAGAAVLGQAVQEAAAQEEKAPIVHRKPAGDPEVPLEVILLGTGSPGISLEEQRGGACEVVLVYGEPLLFDLGHLGLTHLVQAGLHPCDIRHLFFTHTYHYDHFCDFDGFVQVRVMPRVPGQGRSPGMAQRPGSRPAKVGGQGTGARPGERRGQRPDAAAMRRPRRGAGPLFVYGPADTKDRIDLVLRQVYAEDIRAKNLVRRDAVKVRLADEGVVCETEQWKVTSTHVKHGPNALGYRIDAGGKSVAISGDVAEPVEAPENARPGPVRYIAGFPCESIERLAAGVDLFIIDACARHNTPKELAAAVVRTNPKKVVLTHVQSTASAIVYRDEIKNVYQGEIIIAENLKRIRV